MAKEATVKRKARRYRNVVNSKRTSRPSLHRKRTVNTNTMDSDGVLEDGGDIVVPCVSDIERSGSDTESVISISSVSSKAQSVISISSVSTKASSKVKVGPQPSEDPINDQPMPPVETAPHSPAAFSDEEEGAPFPLPKSYYRDVLPAPTDWEYTTPGPDAALFGGFNMRDRVEVRLVCIVAWTQEGPPVVMLAWMCRYSFALAHCAEFLALEGIEKETEIQIWDPADVSWKDTTVSADDNTLRTEQSYILVRLPKLQFCSKFPLYVDRCHGAERVSVENLPIPTTMPNYWKIKDLMAYMVESYHELD